MSKITNVDDFEMRLEELRASGTLIEVLDLSYVKDGIPPDLSAASHPDCLIAGEAIPNPELSCILSSHSGIYNPGMVSSAALEMYQLHNEMGRSPDPTKTGLSMTFDQAVHNIASLAISGNDPAPAAQEYNNNTPGLG